MQRTDVITSPDSPAALVTVAVGIERLRRTAVVTRARVTLSRISLWVPSLQTTLLYQSRRTAPVVSMALLRVRVRKERDVRDPFCSTLRPPAIPQVSPKRRRRAPTQPPRRKGLRLCSNVTWIGGQRIGVAGGTSPRRWSHRNIRLMLRRYRMHHKNPGLNGSDSSLCEFLGRRHSAAS